MTFQITPNSISIYLLKGQYVMNKGVLFGWQELMVEIEVRAAHNVLEACAQTDTIEKVIFTSSVTAVIWRDGIKTMSSDVDERHWSDVNLCKKFKVTFPFYP